MTPMKPEDDGDVVAQVLDVTAWGQYSADPRSASRKVRFQLTHVPGWSLERELHDGLEMRGLMIRMKDLRYEIHAEIETRTINLHSWGDS